MKVRLKTAIRQAQQQEPNASRFRIVTIAAQIMRGLKNQQDASSLSSDNDEDLRCLSDDKNAEPNFTEFPEGDYEQQTVST